MWLVERLEQLQHQEGETVKPLPRQLGNGLQVRHRQQKGNRLYARCTACNTDVSIGSGGRNDLTRHLTSKTHLAKAEAISSTPSIKNAFFKPASNDPVVRAEVYFATFIAEHNLSFTDLVKVMFPDSEIAKKFLCRRTKWTNIVTKALAPVADTQVTRLCRNNKFSIMMDESNDQSDSKCVAILVRVNDSATAHLPLPIVHPKTT
ncbi:hypothetical protein MAR_037117 [Mya arenaria]|uniref:Transposase n=1 Tax=Mya arenaria TaxID=6604 RepID=A0ABY7FML3_MYAAR|nr:hypothetical protein MAR_037117 [Mya arenaria]